MEVRERRTKETRDILSTVEKDLSKHLREYDGDQEAVDYNNKSAHPDVKKKFDSDPNWSYPMKPAFLTDDDDDDSDEEDEDGDDMAIMTSCCCCFSTKNGTIAIGVICLIVAFAIAVASCFALINVDLFQVSLKAQYDEFSDNVANNITDARFALVDTIIGASVLIDNLRIVFIVCLVFYSLYTFSSLFLTYGACTDLRTLLLPWIVLEFVPFAVQLAGIVIVFVYGKADPALSEGGTYIIAGLAQIVAFVIHVYWWMCPVSQYQSLKESTEVEPLVAPTHPLYPNIQKY